eukprot:gb/GFBE01079938.1/.p1 GENE.gb/GFBE01079938.1/~~gb/GFBE01079938.1/.p1  ORF type:complete len:106 (+),score=21.77 gb/GFBE01079938.1/:1-318(+)
MSALSCFDFGATFMKLVRNNGRAADGLLERPGKLALSFWAPMTTKELVVLRTPQTPKTPRTPFSPKYVMWEDPATGAFDWVAFEDEHSPVGSPRCNAAIRQGWFG